MNLPTLHEFGLNFVPFLKMLITPFLIKDGAEIMFHFLAKESQIVRLSGDGEGDNGDTEALRILPFKPLTYQAAICVLPNLRTVSLHFVCLS